MPFTLKQYQLTRPYLFHLTRQENVRFIAKTRKIKSATITLTENNRHEQITKHRPKDLAIPTGQGIVFLRDQAPLFVNNIEFTDGWNKEKLFQELNRRVYFWPGNAKGPIEYGIRHFGRYEQSKPAVLRVQFQDVITLSPSHIPYFCSYNSGSPRYSNGRPSPRGLQTFLPADIFPLPPSKVVEVTFLNEVLLPEATEVADSYEGPWKPLFESK